MSLQLAWAVRDSAKTHFCKGNFNFDDDVDGSDAYTFKLHFGRSLLKNPCPPDGPAPVGKTWQNTSNADYDDGYYQKGIAWPEPRFFDNEDGTVRDNLTGLIWLKNANCFGSRTWEQAISDCNGLASGSCGLIDDSYTGIWRLPNRKELETLLDFERSNPALPLGHPFINVQTSYYWSSTTFVDNTSNVWIVWMGNGLVNNAGNKLDNFYTWPVRGGH